MATLSPSWVFGVDIEPSRIVRQDAANDHQVLKAVLGDTPIGVTHEGSRDAPIPGITALAAKQGESARVYGDTETCEVVVGTIAVLAGEYIAPDANSLGQPAVHGFPYVGKAQAAGLASGKVRIQVEKGVLDNTGITLVKTGDYTVQLRDLGKTLTNTGAAGAVTFALPAAVVGYEVFARVTAAQELRLDPNGTETIALPSTGVQGAAGKYLTANAATETVHLKCNATGTWDVLGFTGTWTAEA